MNAVHLHDNGEVKYITFNSQTLQALLKLDHEDLKEKGKQLKDYHKALKEREREKQRAQRDQDMQDLFNRNNAKEVFRVGYTPPKTVGRAQSW